MIAKASTDEDMDIDSCTTEVLIERVGWRPRFIANSMITIRDAVEPAFVVRVVESSSSGLLDNLPAEILHMVFNLLDLRSLSRFARVSYGGRATIASFPPYRDLIKHAYPALVALGRTGLVTSHSIASLYHAMRSEKCVTCQEFGPFLFLPTSERCCYVCLHRIRSFRLITAAMCRKCFGLTAKDLCQIPSLRSIPGTYSVGHTTTQKRRIKLFSLKHAETLGIAKYGSAEALRAFTITQSLGKLTNLEVHEVAWLTGDPATIGSDANIGTDRFCGMGSTIFPALKGDNLTERGIWCLGCYINFLNFSKSNILDSETKSLLSRPDLFGRTDPYFRLRDLEHQARSEADLINHVRVCKGAKNLLRGLEPGAEASKNWI